MIIYRELAGKINQLALITAIVAASAVSSYAADIYLVVKAYEKTMPDGTVIPMWGFAADLDGDLGTDEGETPSLPGPMITMTPADPTLNIHLRNDLNVPVSIVIPGQKTVLDTVRITDASGRTRVKSFTHETPPNGTGLYSWNDIRPGTYLYHSGTNPSVQVPMGLYGGLLKDAADSLAYNGNPNIDASYDSQTVLLYSEIDPALNAAVTDGTFGTAAYPGTINYNPAWFLINGEPYTSGQTPLPAGSPGAAHLVRFLNAGLKTHVPMLVGGYLKVIAEDGNEYPYPKEQYSVLLSPGNTKDAVFKANEAGTYPLLDRCNHLVNGDGSHGGMLTALEISLPAGAPLAIFDIYSTMEETFLNISTPGVFSNDTGAVTAILVTDASNGALTLNADGSFDYMPALNFNGTDVFEYKASNGSLESNVATVAITVNPVNDAPVAVNDEAGTEEGIAVVIDLLANDSDVDGDNLTVSLVDPPVSGLVAVNADNTVTYTPDPLFTGADSFTYMAGDGLLDSNVASVSISVSPHVNIAPVAVDDYASTGMNAPVTFTLVANDTDEDGTIDPTTVTIMTEPTRRGTVVSNGDGTVTFTPRRNFRGTDVFTYTVSDNEGSVSNEATVRVNVTR